MFDLAAACAEAGARIQYISGYPVWKLRPVADTMDVTAFSWRTLVTYALLQRVPPKWRPSDAWLFRWQDSNFDRLAARSLTSPGDGSSSFIHAMPGQCLRTFQQAKRLGMMTVLNHPTGPVGMQLDAVRGEYERVGLPLPDQSAHTQYLLSLEAEEYALADFHCVASTVVKEQLLTKGVAEEQIWVVPYGADSERWKPGNTPNAGADEKFRIVFAGQLSLRKGFRFLLEALEQAGDRPWQLDVYGRVVDETLADREAYAGTIPVKYHGPVDQAELAEAFRTADLLALPSLEEGFGLVVPQALSCGIPCVVSDRVGAKDLISEGVNGSVFRCGDAANLCEKLGDWSHRRIQLDKGVGWIGPAATLMEYARTAAASPLASNAF